jgi:hypothetical protein
VNPVEIAKALILGKFAGKLTEKLYGGRSLDDIPRYLARDIRIVSRDNQQRLVSVIRPGMFIDTTANNVFGSLTPTIDDMLEYTLKSSYALQVGFNYGVVGRDWKIVKHLYSSRLYALERVIVEVEGRDITELDKAKAAAKRLVDALLTYVDDVFVEYSGNRSYYIGAWLPEPLRRVKVNGMSIGLEELYKRMGIGLTRGLGGEARRLVDMQFLNAAKLLRVPGFRHEETGRSAEFLDADLKPAEFDPGIMDRAVLSPSFVTSIVNSIILGSEGRRPRRRQKGRPGKVSEWGLVINVMLKEGVKVTDGRRRFSYVLGNWCGARGISLDECREIHTALVENANMREYQYYLELGYKHPKYLPWPYTFFRGNQWYSVPDVKLFQEVCEQLSDRVSHIHDAKPAPKPVEVSEFKPESKPVEADNEANQGSAIKVKAGLETKPAVETQESRASASSEGRMVLHSSGEGPKTTVESPQSKGKRTNAEALSEAQTAAKHNEPKPKIGVEAKVSREAQVETEEDTEGEVKAGHEVNPLIIEARFKTTQSEGTATAEPSDGGCWGCLQPVAEMAKALEAMGNGNRLTINISDFINHQDAPVVPIIMHRSIIHHEAIKVPVNLATVNAIARRLCRGSEECLVSARLVIIFILNTVSNGPVRLSWLERALRSESRYMLHYEVLRGSGVQLSGVLTQLRGLGINIIGDIATPDGWHPRWLMNLIPRLLKGRGSLTISDIVKLLRESECGLPGTFVGDVTLNDLVTLTVRHAAWRGLVRIEGEEIILK